MGGGADPVYRLRVSRRPYYLYNYIDLYRIDQCVLIIRGAQFGGAVNYFNSRWLRKYLLSFEFYAHVVAPASNSEVVVKRAVCGLHKYEAPAEIPF